MGGKLAVGGLKSKKFRGSSDMNLGGGFFLCVCQETLRWTG